MRLTVGKNQDDFQGKLFNFLEKLGLLRREVDRKYDDAIAFAEARYMVCERILLTRILNTINRKLKRLNRMKPYATHPAKLDKIITFRIDKWSEYKMYSSFIQQYSDTLQSAYNKTLEKYNLKDIISINYNMGLYMGPIVTVSYKVTDKNLLIDTKGIY